MAFTRQLLLTLVFLAAAGAAWLWLDPAPGRYLLADGSPLPAAMRPLVSTLSPADDAPPAAATARADREAGSTPLVVVDPAVPDVTRDRLRAVGTGEAERSVAVYPEGTGIVSAIGFRSGDLVDEGSVLAVLQNEDERLALDRARIVLDAAEAQVERFEALASSSSVSTVQVEEVRRAADTARLDVRAAEIALQRRNIVSPISGRVGLTAVQPGALVGTQTLIATVDDRSRLKVVFNAPEAFVSGLRVGHPVEATPTTRTGRIYSGEITALDSRIDEASRTLRTEAMIDNEADDLRPGMSFSVDIAFDGEAYLSVDPLAVQWERAGSFVWVVEGETVAKAPVQIVERNIDRVLVASEVLQEGDPVVTEGVAQLREGLAVRLRDATGPSLPAPAAEGVPSAAADPAGPAAAVGPVETRADADAARPPRVAIGRDPATPGAVQ